MEEKSKMNRELTPLEAFEYVFPREEYMNDEDTKYTKCVCCIEKALKGIETNMVDSEKYELTFRYTNKSYKAHRHMVQILQTQRANKQWDGVLITYTKGLDYVIEQWEDKSIGRKEVE